LAGGGYVEDVEPNNDFKDRFDICRPDGTCKYCGSDSTCNPDKSRLPNINMKAILISSIIFIVIVVWFNVITNLFNEAYPDPNSTDSNDLLFFRSIKSFWYALFITALSLFICLIIYYW
jgi:hypothetical protein